MTTILSPNNQLGLLDKLLLLDKKLEVNEQKLKEAETFAEKTLAMLDIPEEDEIEEAVTGVERDLDNELNELIKESIKDEEESD